MREKKSSPYCTFAVFVSVLEGLHQPQSLIHRSPHRKIVHCDLPQDAFVIDDEKSPERHSHKAYSKLPDPRPVFMSQVCLTNQKSSK